MILSSLAMLPKARKPFFADEVANIRILQSGDAEDTSPIVEASTSCNPVTGKARTWQTDLHNYKSKGDGRSLRKDLVEFLDKLISFGVRGFSRDYWNDRIDGDYIQDSHRQATDPCAMSIREELSFISRVLSQEILAASDRITR